MLVADQSTKPYFLAQTGLGDCTSFGLGFVAGSLVVLIAKLE